MPAGSFNANSQNSGVISADVVDVVVAGTFTGTIQLQTQIGGAWVPFGANITAAGASTTRVGAGRGWRLATIAWSSGTANYELNGAHDKSLAVAL